MNSLIFSLCAPERLSELTALANANDTFCDQLYEIRLIALST